MKNRKEFRALAICLVVVGIVLLIQSATVKIPDDYMNYYGDVYKYVGGDAYNYIIEAQFRANEISTAKIIQVIYLVAGIAFLAVGVGVNVATFIPDKGEKINADITNPQIQSKAESIPAILEKSVGAKTVNKEIIEEEKLQLITPALLKQEDVKLKAIELLTEIFVIEDKEKFYLELEKWQDKYGGKLLYWDLTLYNKIGNFFNNVSWTSTYDSAMKEKRVYNIEDENYESIVNAIKEFCDNV